MPEKEFLSGKEGVYLYTVSADGERRLTARLRLSGSNLLPEDAHIPFGGVHLGWAI